MEARTLVARNIRRIRVARGLSQEALAEDAEIDRTYVNRLERNLENPTVLVLERLAAALKCKVGDLFVHSGEQNRHAQGRSQEALVSQIPLGGWINVGRKVMLQLTTSAKDRASDATLAVIVRAPK
jgi:transcriptional regulator with XRE-family HTH domain